MLSSLDPTAVTPSQRLEVIDCLTAWNKRRWVCDAIEEEPITKVRRGLTVLFDKSKDVRERLDRVERDGLLPGLRIPSLSLLLYWREPKLYVPFDQKTEIFLRDFKLRGRGISDGNGTCYSRWLSHATRIQQWLELPTLGHVDRVVTAYRDRFARAG